MWSLVKVVEEFNFEKWLNIKSSFPTLSPMARFYIRLCIIIHHNYEEIVIQMRDLWSDQGEGIASEILLTQKGDRCVHNVVENDPSC